LVGGSLGARTLNESVLASINAIRNSNVEVIWQTGKYYSQEIQKRMQGVDCPNLQIHEFISRMDFAYSAADLVISRAGAGTISELCLMGKPSILVPSPNVAEDHQTKNAQALVEKQAAVMVRDNQAVEKLFINALNLIDDSEQLSTLSKNIVLLAKPDAASDIAKIVIGLAKKK
jgi:UDP-N-acetylglucosamine--N-acetylmuramyl-(pentapeptide) pyrophosphoryl-undecaprenol N-acetylglucosamine transferase